MAWHVYMCPVETETAFQSSLGPFAVNKHKRASREGRQTGSHLINSQTLLQIMEAHAFITGGGVLHVSFQSGEAVYRSSGQWSESSVHVWITTRRSISARIVPDECQHDGKPITSRRVCNLNLDVITVCVHSQMEEEFVLASSEVWSLLHCWQTLGVIKQNAFICI